MGEKNGTLFVTVCLLIMSLFLFTFGFFIKMLYLNGLLVCVNDYYNKTKLTFTQSDSRKLLCDKYNQLVISNRNRPLDTTCKQFELEIGLK